MAGMARAVQRAASRTSVPPSRPIAPAARAISLSATRMPLCTRGLSTGAEHIEHAAGAAADLAAENERLKLEVGALRAQVAQAPAAGATFARRSGAVALPGPAIPPGAEHAARRRVPEPPGVEAGYSMFVGAPRSRFTPELAFWDPSANEPLPSPMPCFRLIDDVGQVVPGAEAWLPDLDRALCLRMMGAMLRVSEFDKVFNQAQRQGRIAFYLTSRGEEACSIGSAAALSDSDWLLPQYRELGSALWRGMSFTEIANQATANALDPARGRQLPLHFGSRQKRIVYVKSTLGTQLPHAAGIGYRAKMMKGKDQVALTYFGEGCASEGDVPSAFNIAAVHGCPTIFFCRNNGYAISTNAKDQYVSDGVAPRGYAYGLPALRVDGNDVLAVYAATAAARAIASGTPAPGTLRGGAAQGVTRPAILEAMTYRVGAHSTSDDDSKYRTEASPDSGWDSERSYWEARSPIVRFGRFLHAKGWFSVGNEEDIRREARREAIDALNTAERVGRPPSEFMFTDVWDQPPPALRRQQHELQQHLARHAEHYPGFPS